MHIDLFSVGPFTVHSYGFMIAIGFLAAVLLGSLSAKRKGLDSDAVYSIGLVAVITGFLGGKILYCIVEWKRFIANPLSCIGTSGFVVYGGIAVGFLCVILYCKCKKLTVLQYLDTLIPFVAMAQGFGRIGCFLAGCCYGAQTDSCLGVVFPTDGLAPSGVRLIPTQLISSAGDFLLFVFLLVLTRYVRKPGWITSFYLALYSAGRFAIEFFRGDDRGFIGSLSTSQFLSIILFVLALLLFPVFYKMDEKQKNSPVEAGASPTNFEDTQADEQTLSDGQNGDNDETQIGN